MAPHIGRFQTLTLSWSSPSVLNIAKVFCSPAPVLERLKIRSCGSHFVAIENALFNGDFSSLRELRLNAVVTNLPWRDLSMLTTFDFVQCVLDAKTSVTQLLNFFERAPLLREIKLVHSLPSFSDAPTERVVSLPRLKWLEISAYPAHSTLLNHLRIPTRASVRLGFSLEDRNTKIRDYLPRSLDALSNISHITSIRLGFKSGTAMWLGGPSGALGLNGVVERSSIDPTNDHRIEFLDELPISTTKRLAIYQYRIPEIKVYQTLLTMNNLHTLILKDCINISFFFVLNPALNPSNTVLCPKLEVLILDAQEREAFYANDLLGMVEERASRGAKLLAIVITCPYNTVSENELSSLRRCASRVEHVVR